MYAEEAQRHSRSVGPQPSRSVRPMLIISNYMGTFGHSPLYKALGCYSLASEDGNSRGRHGPIVSQKSRYVTPSYTFQVSDRSISHLSLSFSEADGPKRENLSKKSEQ